MKKVFLNGRVTTKNSIKISQEKWQKKNDKMIQKLTFFYISKWTEIIDIICISEKHIKYEGNSKNLLDPYENISGIILISLISVDGKDNCTVLKYQYVQREMVMRLINTLIIVIYKETAFIIGIDILSNSLYIFLSNF